VVPIEIKVLCIIYKFGANILTFNKLFIIGRSIVSFYVSKMVMAIDVVFKEFMMWPIGCDDGVKNGWGYAKCDKY